MFTKALVDLVYVRRLLDMFLILAAMLISLCTALGAVGREFSLGGTPPGGRLDMAASRLGGVFSYWLTVLPSGPWGGGQIAAAVAWPGPGFWAVARCRTGDAHGPREVCQAVSGDGYLGGATAARCRQRATRSEAPC